MPPLFMEENVDIGTLRSIRSNGGKHAIMRTWLGIYLTWDRELDESCLCYLVDWALPRELYTDAARAKLTKEVVLDILTLGVAMKNVIDPIVYAAMVSWFGDVFAERLVRGEIGSNSEVGQAILVRASLDFEDTGILRNLALFADGTLSVERLEDEDVWVSGENPFDLDLDELVPGLADKLALTISLLDFVSERTREYTAITDDNNYVRRHRVF